MPRNPSDRPARPTKPHQPAEPHEPLEPARPTKPATPSRASRPLTPPETSWEKHARLNAEKERQRAILNGRSLKPLRTTAEVLEKFSRLYDAD